MKILLLSQHWYPENGVPQRRWAWLTKILVESGHQVYVLTPPAHYKRTLSGWDWIRFGGFAPAEEFERGQFGELILRTGFFPAGSSITARALNQGLAAMSMLSTAAGIGSKQLQRVDMDLVIGTVPALPTAVVTGLVASFKRVPYVIDLRDAWPDLLRESHRWNKNTGKTTWRERLLSKGPLQLVALITEQAINFSLSRAAGVVTTSKELELHLRKRFGISENDESFLTIRNVFPLKSAAKPRSPRRDVANKELHVLYAGTLGRAQGLENALLAAAIARSWGYNIKLRFVGNGATTESLLEKAKELEIDFQLMDRVPAASLDGYYEWADTALAHLTGWEPLTRTIPSKTFELMQLGIHITAVVSGETAQLVRDLEAGDVVHPENPEALAKLWIELIENRERLEIGDRGRRWVEKERTEVVPKLLQRLIDFSYR